MGKHATILAVAGAWLAATAFVACSSSRPADASFDSVNDEAGTTGSPGTGNKRVSGGGTTGSPLCADDSDSGSGFREPAGTCSCAYAYSTQITITLPCGVTLCSDGKQEAAACSTDGRLTLIPHVTLAYCADAGAPDLTKLPPCDAGAPTPDAAIADAAIADAATTD